jgi:glutathione S-transferase
MTLKLHDDPLSASCHSVRLMLSMLDIPHERIPVDAYPGRAHRSAAFLALNPLGELPVIEDRGVVLGDAPAILVYLAARHDPQGRWHPRDAVRMLR